MKVGPEQYYVGFTGLRRYREGLLTGVEMTKKDSSQQQATAEQRTGILPPLKQTTTRLVPAVPPLNLSRVKPNFPAKPQQIEPNQVSIQALANQLEKESLSESKKWGATFNLESPILPVSKTKHRHSRNMAQLVSASTPIFTPTSCINEATDANRALKTSCDKRSQSVVQSRAKSRLSEDLALAPKWRY